MSLEPVLFALKEWAETQMPENLNPLKANLKDSLERKRIARVLSADLGTPVGYVLPLHWNRRKNTWVSNEWKFRRSELFLVPGDSTMGLRLPLASLPWVEVDKRDEESERSLFEKVGPLGDFAGEVARRYGKKIEIEKPHPEIQEQAPADSDSETEKKL